MTNMCDVCGLPEELCICEDVSKSETEVTVTVEDRKYNDVTVASGFDIDDIDIKDLASELKSTLACGGTITNDNIELQGNHKQELKDKLREKGYIVK